MEYSFITDAGHGWIAVKRSELERLGLAGKISHHSYQQGGTVYLEEDDDAQVFLREKRQRGEPYYFQDIRWRGRSPIRNLQPYRARQINKGEINKKHPLYWERRKRLADPAADVICVVVLTVALLLAGYMHLSI